MISYYPNMGHLNEMFDNEVRYKEGDPEAEAQAQAIYEACVKIYNAGYGAGYEAGMCKMTKEEKQTYLDKHNDAIYCSQICSALPKYWWCSYRSPKHILECKDFKPKENKKGVEL